jgi:hypothetical protein
MDERRRRSGRVAAPVCVRVAALLLLITLAAGPARAAIFTVDRTDDLGDSNPGNGTCSVGGAPPRCTFRAALQEASLAAGAPHTISFAILPAGAKTISITAALPQIRQRVTIDGTTQTGSVGGIEISAAACGANAALDLGTGSSGSTIRGLVVNRCPSRAIRVIGSNNNVIVGNYLGTDATGTAARGNGTGIYIESSGNTVGGTAAAARNVISGNTTDGVQVYGAPAVNNSILGNLIGLDASGNLDLGNANTGVAIWGGATGNTVGGTALGARNVISGNDLYGVAITTAGTSGNRVEGNYIGTDAVGAAAVANSSHGVMIATGAASNTIGGSVAARNVISGNTLQGVYIAGAGTSGNVVSSNFIGTDAAGTADLGNGRSGVTVNVAAASNTIGGTAAGAGNRLAFNTQAGVDLEATAGNGNAVLGNEIRDNDGIGIDFGNDGPTANDTGDADTGPNGQQNFPVLTAAMTNGTQATFAGSLVATAAVATYRIEFFTSTASDPSGYGEGERFLGFANVTTDAAGMAAIGVTLSPSTPLAAGEYVTATATPTVAPYNTSELGNAVQAVGHLVVTTTSDSTTGSSMGSVSALIADPGDDGRISLREAITATNNTGGADTIRFGIPLADAGHVYYQDDAAGSSLTVVKPTTLADSTTAAAPGITDFDVDYPAGLARGWYRIQPGSALPTVVGALVIDASSQPLSSTSGPVVEIVGSSLGGNTYCFAVTSASVTVRGLVIDQFPGEAITSSGASTVIAGNYIGTDPSGTLARGNGTSGFSAGVYLAGDGSEVGGPGAADRNVISGNLSDGIWIDADSITVRGNLIGTTVTGAAALGNAKSGIVLSAVGGPTVTNVVIGGTAASARNVVSGNVAHGVELQGAEVQGDVVEGNHIGTDVAGIAALPNGQNGVYIHAAASGNTVGGVAAGSGNVISGNGARGVRIDGAGTNANTLARNRIGTDVTGTLDLGNAQEGVLVTGGARLNVIGAVSPAGNVISGNDLSGVVVNGAGTSDNSVVGNIIGLDASGTAVLGNAHYGVALSGGASGNVVGGAAGNGNVISGNGLRGLNVVEAGTSANRVIGNIIGLDAAGTAVRGNPVGVVVGQSATANVIGEPGAGNTISGNGTYGVFVVDGGTNGNRVQSNRIGTDATGTVALGNGSDGIRLSAAAAATGNVIGGTSAGYGNLVSGNGGSGIQIRDLVSGTLVAGNTIGTNASGDAALPNLQHGVALSAGTTGNTIGGPRPWSATSSRATAPEPTARGCGSTAPARAGTSCSATSSEPTGPAPPPSRTRRAGLPSPTAPPTTRSGARPGT